MSVLPGGCTTANRQPIEASFIGREDLRWVGGWVVAIKFSEKR